MLKKRQNLVNVVCERPLVHMLFPKAHILLYSRLREMEESLIQVFLPKLMHLHQLLSLLILSLICKGPACKITYSIVGTYNKVFSLFSFLLLILDQNWVLLGDETHMANLLSPTQVLRRAAAWRYCGGGDSSAIQRRAEKAQSMTGLSCLMNHPKASFFSSSLSCVCSLTRLLLACLERTLRSLI